MRFSLLASVTSLKFDLSRQIFDELFASTVGHVVHVQSPCNLSQCSKTVVLSCTTQNVACSQEIWPSVPTISDLPLVFRPVDIVIVTQCLCLFQQWRSVRGTPALDPPPPPRALEPGSTHPQRVMSALNISKPILNAKTSINRPAERVAPGEKSSMCTAHLYSRPTNRTFIFQLLSFIRQPFSQRVVRNSSFVAYSRFMSSTTKCANKLSSAFSVASASACLSSSPPAPRQSDHVSSAASWSNIPSSSVSHLPVCSSIEALGTKSSARQHFSAGSSSSEPVVSTIILFRVSVSVRSILVVASVQSRIQAPQPLRRFNNCRIWGLASETSPSCHRPSTLSHDQPSRYLTRVESKMTWFQPKMIHPFEVFRPFLPSRVSPASASVAYHVGPETVHPMAATFQQRNINTLNRRKSADSSCNLLAILSDNDVCVVFQSSARALQSDIGYSCFSAPTRRR